MSHFSLPFMDIHANIRVKTIPPLTSVLNDVLNKKHIKISRKSRKKLATVNLLTLNIAQLAETYL